MLAVGDTFPAITVPVQQGTQALPTGETLDLGETDALQTEELCPCNWSQGEEVLRPAA